MVVAAGFFDGVHTGHREVLGRLVAEARARGEESMVVTFWPHPRTVLRQEARSLRILTSLEEKKEMILSLGVDRVEVIPFDKAFAALTTEQFLSEYVIGRFGGKAILLGYDNRIGSDCLTPEDVTAVARRLGLDVVRTGMVPSGSGFAVSSTKIRLALGNGLVGDAAQMLGYNYSLRGVVVAGNRMGRTIGFPTANLHLYDPLKLVPGNGVYSVLVEVQGEKKTGMCNIGVRPTVGERNARTIETNIFDFDEEIYGLDLKVNFLAKIRDEVKFASLDALKEQLEKDRNICLSKGNN